MYCNVYKYRCNTCVASTGVIHMLYTCHTPKTRHIYYRCGAIGHVFFAFRCCTIYPKYTISYCGITLEQNIVAFGCVDCYV